MRPQGSPEELERRRRRAIDLLKAGASVTDGYHPVDGRTSLHLFSA